MLLWPRQYSIIRSVHSKGKIATCPFLTIRGQCDQFVLFVEFLFSFRFNNVTLVGNVNRPFFFSHAYMYVCMNDETYTHTHTQVKQLH